MVRRSAKQTIAAALQEPLRRLSGRLFPQA
jgi:hypothetical protein